MSSTAITTADVGKARAALLGLRGSLTKWLKYRQMNDDIASGKLPSSKLPQNVAAQVAVGMRNAQRELALAQQLHALLTDLMPDTQLPAAEDSGAAVSLAKVAVLGASAATTTSAPATTGSVSAWPILIVGGLLLGVTGKIRSDAEVAAEHEHRACIRAGGCADYSFLWKVAGGALLGWVAWTRLGLGDAVHDALEDE